MTPARSLAASVVALGFTGALSSPLPAVAAPAPCERAESYAAQAGAELLRIDKLAVQVPEVRYKKSPVTESAEASDAAARVLGAVDDPIPDPEDSDTLSEGIGMLGTAVLGTLAPRRSADAQGSAAAKGSPATPGAAQRSATGQGSKAAQRSATGQGSKAAQRSAARRGSTAAQRAAGGQGSAAARPSVAGQGPAAARPSVAGQGSAAARPSVAGQGSVAPRSKAAVGSDGDADVVRPADAVTGQLGEAVERGGGVVSGLTEAEDPRGIVQAVGVAARNPGGDEADGTSVVEDEGNDDDADDSGSDKSGDARGDGSGDASDSAGNDDSRTKSAPGEDETEAPTGGVAAEKGRSASVSDVGVGETRTAMIAQAQVSSAAYGRMLDGQSKDNTNLSKPLLQKAPPTNAKPAQRSTPAGQAGPLRVGAGQVSAHAQWNAGMACGRTVGETTRAESRLTNLRLLDGLVRVPQKLSSLSTTALERNGEAARSVASATVTTGRIELADGKVRVRVLRPPTLTTAMSAEGGTVDYRPAVLEVSGDGIATKRLAAVGDHADITLTPDRHATESVPLSHLTELTKLGQGSPLAAPSVPGLPPVSAAPGTAIPKTESARAGTRLRISVGDVRHAQKGNAIAARAAAVKVSLVQGADARPGAKDRGRTGYGSKPQVRTTLDMTFGVLESAAVSPAAGQPAAGTGGAGGGLPVTGPRVDRLAMVGGGLLLAGIAAVALGMRRRRSQP
ncbi:hypothetical protein AB0J83_15965 [Actinoplanes sp. NPDC049596]|uniref:hypothetical protein n=1 Tax=unclassified Actinoplanes TaxID=2626549 RepID=UPI003448E9DE